MVKIEELADFVRESCSQLLRFAARGDRFADANDSSIVLDIAVTRNDRICAHDFTMQNLGTGSRINQPSIMARHGQEVVSFNTSEQQFALVPFAFVSSCSRSSCHSEQEE
jgi:hypothetical protein